MEKKTLSHLETFALTKAREAAAIAGAEFDRVIKDVVDAHGVPEADRPNWRFSMDFTRIEYHPVPPKGKPVATTPKKGGGK